MTTGYFEANGLRIIGYLSIFFLTLLFVVPARGEEPLTNAGKALVSGVDLAGKQEIIGKRTTSSKTFSNPDGSFTFVTGINPVHYKDAKDGWKEIDTKINPRSPIGSAAFDKLRPRASRGELAAGGNPHAQNQTHDDFDYEMTENSWHVYFKERFNDGPVLKYEHGGEWVTIRPESLKWVSKYGQQELISRPQGKDAEVSANTIYYPGGYGSGLDMRYLLVPEKIVKELIIMRTWGEKNR